MTPQPAKLRPCSSELRAPELGFQVESSVTRSPLKRRLRNPAGKLPSRGYSQPPTPTITWATDPLRTTRRRPARNRPRPAPLTKRRNPKLPLRLLPLRRSKVSSVGPRPHAHRRTGLLPRHRQCRRLFQTTTRRWGSTAAAPPSISGMPTGCWPNNTTRTSTVVRQIPWRGPRRSTQRMRSSVIPTNGTPTIRN